MTSKRKWVCPQCDGYGFILIEEDDHMVQHACYHCGTEGYLPYDPDLGPNDDIWADDGVWTPDMSSPNHLRR